MEFLLWGMWVPKEGTVIKSQIFNYARNHDAGILTAKALLCCQPKIDYHIKIYHRKNLILATHSSYIQQSAEQIAAQVIDRAWRTQDLYTLKNKIETVVAKLPPKYQTIIQLYFFDGIHIKNIAKQTKVEPRTIFRQINRSIELFAENMNPEFNTFIINNLLRDHRFFMREYYDTKNQMLSDS